MGNKVRNIYEVAISEVTYWDDKNDFPKPGRLIKSADGNICFLTTTNITDAYRFFRKYVDSIKDKEFCGLVSRDMEISDKEWRKLLEKDKLECADYEKYRAESKIRVLAWEYSYEGKTDGDDYVLEEMLAVQSENFKMRVICKKAGISYSKYLRFKNNKRALSSTEKMRILRTMHFVGNDCWEEEFDNNIANIIIRSNYSSSEKK